MEKVFTHDIKQHINKEVTLKGWVYSFRRSGKIGFLTFRDGFGLLQCIVAKNDIGDEGAKSIATSPSLEKLESLKLGQNKIGVEGARALNESENLKNLTHPIFGFY